jgi:hypothetical protein
MTDTGGPAFPTKNYAAIQPLAEGYSEGMSLRDWFAGLAMQAYLTAPDTGWKFDEVAGAAYEMADAMLKERSK